MVVDGSCCGCGGGGSVVVVPDNVGFKKVGEAEEGEDG